MKDNDQLRIAIDKIVLRNDDTAANFFLKKTPVTVAIFLQEYDRPHF